MRKKLRGIHSVSIRTKVLASSALMVSILGMGVLLGNIPPSRILADSGSKVVSIYFDGQKRVATTDAATVGEVLGRAQITLGEGDRVEPTAETAITAGVFNINVFRGRLYRIVDGDTTVLVKSAQKTPRLVAADAGITLYEEDRVSTNQIHDFIGDQMVGENIVVDRALPVTLIADGISKTARTHSKTVGALLAEQSITLGEQDSVSPGLEIALSAGQQISVKRVEIITSTKEEIVTRRTVKQADATMLRGSSRVDQEGQDGKREVTYQVTYHNGLVVSTKELKSTVLERPIDRIVTVGTRILYANEVVAIAAQIAGERGWVEEQWDALFNLWSREANFNPKAVNASSGACGIPQALPCGKMGPVNDDRTSAVSVEGQISWGLGYIANRYGDPVNAWAFWRANRWY